MKKTSVVPGKPVVMKTREDEEQLVMEWIELQSTYSDSIRYLIQKEIAENGLRNLQEFIPPIRSIESLKQQLSTVPAPPPIVHRTPEKQAPPFTSTPEPERVVLYGSPEASPQSEKPISGREDETKGSEIKMEKMHPASETVTSEGKENPHMPSDPTATVQEQTGTQTSPGPAAKRPAGKKFGADVASSYAN